MTNSSGFQLELVQVLFRHGARVYLESEAAAMPNQFIDESLHETYGYGQLTNIGKSQAHRLGRNLRDRYNDFLGSSYRPRDVYAYSTDNVRTKMTLMLVLAALYPPSADQTWNQNLKWTPIPLRTVPTGLDILFKLYEHPIYIKKMYPVVFSIERVMDRVKLPDVKGFLEKQGVKDFTNNLINVSFSAYNVLSTHKVASAKLPDGYSDNVLSDLREYVTFYFDLMSSTTQLKRLLIGPLLKKFINNMNLDSSTVNPKKLYLYSGHEINLAALIRAHGIQNFIYPDFSSAVIVEKLRDSENQVFIRMLGYTGNDDNFVVLKIKDCEEFCPIKNYLKIIEDILPSDDELNAIFKQMNEVYRKKKSLNSDHVFRPEVNDYNFFETLF